MDGYDTTAYWRARKALIGRSQHSVVWRDVPWHFEMEIDIARFRADPARYARQFGGFCTRAMSFDRIVNADPEVWRIRSGRLYLFALPVGGKKVDESPDQMIAQAQVAWDKLSELAI